MIKNKVWTLLTLQFLLISSVGAAKQKTDIKVLDIEFVKGMTQEKVVEIPLPTSFHGKKKVKKEIHKINSKSMKNNKSAEMYISQVGREILLQQQNHLKKTPAKLSGLVRVKLQIQSDGRYDVLFIDGADVKLITFVEGALSKLKKFSPIPVSAGQGELQLIVPISFKKK